MINVLGIQSLEKKDNMHKLSVFTEVAIIRVDLFILAEMEVDGSMT